MTRIEELHLRIAVTLDRIEMVNGMIKRTKEYMPDDIFLLKDHEGIRQEMVSELYTMFTELGLGKPQYIDIPDFKDDKINSAKYYQLRISALLDRIELLTEASDNDKTDVTNPIIGLKNPAELQQKMSSELHTLLAALDISQNQSVIYKPQRAAA